MPVAVTCVMISESGEWETHEALRRGEFAPDAAENQASGQLSLIRSE
jgi:hypothetical protein